MKFRLWRALPLAILLFAAPLRAEQGTIVGPIVGPHTMADVMGTINAAFLAIQTANSGASAPANGTSGAPVHYQIWADTTTNPVVVKMYDGASWVVVGKLNTSSHIWTPSYQGTDTGTASTATTGTSGHTLGFLDGTNAISGVWTFADAKLVLAGSSSGAGTLKAPAAASTFIWTLPAATGTLADIASTQTFTNKSLTSPAITTPTGIVKGDVGLGSVDNTSDATKNSASVTLTNKTFVCANQASCVIRLGSDVSGQLPIANGGTGQATAVTARQSSGLNVYGDAGTAHGDAGVTIGNTERFAYTNATFTASRAWVLPAANVTGAPYTIKIADLAGGVTASNTLVITRAGSDTINSTTTAIISAANGGYECSSDGSSKWSCLSMGAASAGGVTSVTVAAGAGVAVSGTCVITSSGTCTVGTSAALLTGSVSNAATLDIDFSSIVASYRKIRVYLYDVTVATSGACIDMMVSSNGGSTWDNSAGQYSWQFMELYDDATGVFHAGTTDHGTLDFQYRMSTSLGTVAGYGGAFEITFHNPKGTTIWKYIEHAGSHAFTDGKTTSYKGGGIRKTTSAINAVRIRAANNNNTGATNGNITASYAVYGE